MHRTDRDAAIECGVAGLFLAVMGVFNIFRGWSTSSWRAVPGEVSEAYLSEDERENDDWDDNQNAVTSFFRARILYKYTVYGKEHEGHVLQRGLFRVPFKFFAQLQADTYQRGQRVTVYYLPRDPSQAVLKRGAPPSAYIQFVVGVVLLFIAYKIL